MAAVTVSELVEAVGISEASLRERCTDEHLNSIAHFLDWQTTAPYLGLSEKEIEDIEDEDRRNEVRRRKTLQLWKRKHSFKATYRRLVDVFLSVGRADHAEELCRLISAGGCEIIDIGEIYRFHSSTMYRFTSRSSMYIWHAVRTKNTKRHRCQVKIGTPKMGILDALASFPGSHAPERKH